MRKVLLSSAALFLLAACGGAEETVSEEVAEETTATEETAEEEGSEEADDAAADEQMAMGAHTGDIDAVLADPARSKVAERDQYRNPKETLAFFGVEPGMTVVDVLPGGAGYYTTILGSYLGPDGKVVGADYSPDMWKLFGRFANEEFLLAKQTWVETWTAGAEKLVDGGAQIGAFQYGAVPDDLAGSADAVLMIRAIHHFNRFEDNGEWFTKGLEDTMKVLRPGGIVGVVQHRGPEGNDDGWAKGDNGYLKQSQVIAAFEAAGFELVESSELNANPKDVPTNED
ncbi:MAG: methyltransferase, partial [Pseudomonadota bacterium]